MDIYLLNFNSYFDRTIKRFDSLYEYVGVDNYVVDSISGVNFRPGDGISTELVVNTNYTGVNYLVAVDSDNNKFTRWFIMEQLRLRNGQYKITLRRDVVADFYENVVDSPAYIEKATVPIDNPFIFNSEGMTFNQIKKEETLLKDESKCGWIVGYFANNYPGGEISGEYATAPNYLIDDITNFRLFKYTANNALVLGETVFETKLRLKRYENAGSNEIIVIESNRNSVLNSYVRRDLTTNATYMVSESIIEHLDEIPANAYGSIRTETLEDFWTYSRNNIFLQTKANENLMSFNGKIVQETKVGGAYYRIAIEQLEDVEIESSVTSSSGQIGVSAKNGLDSALASYVTAGSGRTFGNDTLKLRNVCRQYKVTLSPISNITASFSITFPQSYPHLDDAPYSMFAIPYLKDDSVYVSTSLQASGTLYMSPQQSLGIAKAIADAMQPASGGGYLYDLQLLPYCPIANFTPYGSEAGINASLMTENTDYLKVKKGGLTNIGVVFFCRKSSFDVSIDKTITVDEPKISKECDKWRIVSPNHASISEFSPAMNGGVRSFHVNCTYKPYTPYINVHIDYGGLYGKDFDDSRGLICGGDYSLPVISSAWESFQIQNKNYAAIFDREIENLELNNKLDMTSQIFGAIAGTAQGGLMGATAGSGGGPIGSSIGAIAGTLASAAGGIADTMMLAQRQGEAKSFKTDMYNYNLGNIQARPQGLAKSSGFDKTNKIWPYLEFYTCTEQEKDAFRNKLRYNGMTVGAIGKISDYLWPEPTYIKAQIIRMNLAEDAHMANAIYEEIVKGVYI